MRLKEYDGKRILEHVNITTPRGFLAKSSAEVTEKLPMIHSNRVYVKAQVPFGRKTRKGAVIKCTKQEAAKNAELLLKKSIEGFAVQEVLVEEEIPVKEEYFISMTIDPVARCYRATYAEQGGIDFDKYVEQHPELIHSIFFKDFDPDIIKKQIKNAEHQDAGIILAHKLHTAMLDNDAILIEINPLIITPDEQLVAADAQVIIDNDSLFRQTMLGRKRLDHSEAETLAIGAGLRYLESEGEVMIIGNGSGLIMSIADEVVAAGMSVAGYINIGGRTTKEQLQAASKIINLRKPKATLITIYGGIASGKVIAEEVLDQLPEHPDPKLVVHITGNEAEAAKKLLKDAGITLSDSILESMTLTRKLI